MALVLCEPLRSVPENVSLPARITFFACLVDAGSTPGQVASQPLTLSLEEKNDFTFVTGGKSVQRVVRIGSEPTRLQFDEGITGGGGGIPFFRVRLLAEDGRELGSYLLNVI